MNKNFKGKKFTVPDFIIDNIKDVLDKNDDLKNFTGYRRALKVVKNPMLTYKQLEGIRKYFDELVDNPLEYNMNGGDAMKNWCNNKITTLQAMDKRTKKIKHKSGMQNAYIKPHLKKNVQLAIPTKSHSKYKSIYDMPKLKLEQKIAKLIIENFPS